MSAFRKNLRKSRLPSIKEGLDNLPFGIAFANIYGIVILCNRAMQGVSFALQNVELQNADLFWRQVEEQGERTQEGSYILRLRGVIWLIARRQCMLNGREIYEITAGDVTERIHLIDRIGEHNRHLARVGTRLKQYSKNALELTKRRELLERKEHTHDELGRLLSATRHYLDGGDVDGEELWSRWRINAALMLEEAVMPKEGDLLESLRKAAEAVGVRLDIAGDRPEGQLVLELMLAAGGECLTNLLRHTKCTELEIRVENGDGASVITFANDGDLAEGEIVEGGGLTALRRKVEDAGGVMEVSARPRYQLTMTIPVQRGEEYV